MFDFVPGFDHVAGSGSRGITKHVRVAAHQFVVARTRNIGQTEPTLLFGDRGVKFDLVQQVAEFFDEGIVGGGVVGIECVQCVNHFVCLFNQVTHERSVCLLTVPRALLAQGAGQTVQSGHLAGYRLGELWNVYRRQMVGHHTVGPLEAVDVIPCGGHHPFVG